MIVLIDVEFTYINCLTPTAHRNQPDDEHNASRDAIPPAVQLGTAVASGGV